MTTRAAATGVCVDASTTRPEIVPPPCAAATRDVAASPSRARKHQRPPIIRSPRWYRFGSSPEVIELKAALGRVLNGRNRGGPFLHRRADRHDRGGERAFRNDDSFFVTRPHHSTTLW